MGELERKETRGPTLIGLPRERRPINGDPSVDGGILFAVLDTEATSSPIEAVIAMSPSLARALFCRVEVHFPEVAVFEDVLLPSTIFVAVARSSALL